MKVYHYPVPLPTTSMNTTITSPAMQLYNMYGYSIQIVWTGTPTGTFKLQCSTDMVPQGAPASQQAPFIPTHWTDIATSPIAVAAAGDYTWNVFDVMYNYVRIVYTDASGGTSAAVITDCAFNGKGV